jgi:hypothetical protein
MGFLYLPTFFHSDILVNRFFIIFLKKTNSFNILDRKIFNNFVTLCVRDVNKNVSSFTNNSIITGIHFMLLLYIVPEKNVTYT